MPDDKLYKDIEPSQHQHLLFEKALDDRLAILKSDVLKVFELYGPQIVTKGTGEVRTNALQVLSLAICHLAAILFLFSKEGSSQLSVALTILEREISNRHEEDGGKIPQLEVIQRIRTSLLDTPRIITPTGLIPRNGRRM
jgi:hypothetical protein